MNRKSGARSDRTNLYSEVIDKIITELEAGRVPWVQPWGTAAAKAPLGLTKNALDRPDLFRDQRAALVGRGNRTRLLQSWLTFRQALSSSSSG
jgi:antirestriction protein ArdC